MQPTNLGISPALKSEIMFAGIRYTSALAEAAEHSLANYAPYRFKKGEHDPTGTGKADIPYLMVTEDNTLIRIMGNGDSEWTVSGSREQGYRLLNDDNQSESSVSFEPRLEALSSMTSDGFPMARAGVNTHSDMMVINVAPGCEYFLKKHDGDSMRCTFCSYGAPDGRTAHLGQVAGEVDIPEITLQRMQETMTAILAETTIRHIYLVGGSLTDPALEGQRFLQLARAVKDNNPDGVPVCLGSGALPRDVLQQFYDENLVEAVCFNLEVWSEKLFSQVCPGKNNYVGYDGWIESLEDAVGLWGAGRVYSAMVAGIELEPQYDMDWQEAADLAIAGADDLCSRGIIPVYSLYVPTAGKVRSDYKIPLRNFFEKLALEYQEIRQRKNLQVWDGFMCHRCAYMQLECDMDRESS